jgi:hypothetical protein
VRTASWKELCSWIHDRFGHDQHESLIHQLFHIKQSGTVHEYIDQFSELVDQLMAYEHSSYSHYYTTKSVDGLEDDVKVVVLVQCPTDLDTAASLALLQEEAELARRREFKRHDYSFKYKQTSLATPLPLPPPPPKTDKPLVGSSVLEHRNTEVVPIAQIENKVAAMRAYRKAKGLCQFCAKKWDRVDECSPNVQFQAVQELWEMLTIDDDVDSVSVQSDPEL